MYAKDLGKYVWSQRKKAPTKIDDNLENWKK